MNSGSTPSRAWASSDESAGEAPGGGQANRDLPQSRRGAPQEHQDPIPSKGSMEDEAAIREPLRLASNSHGPEMGDAEMPERQYSPEHLAAVIRPVAITMALASAIVLLVNDKAQSEAISQGLK